MAVAGLNDLLIRMGTETVPKILENFSTDLMSVSRATRVNVGGVARLTWALLPATADTHCVVTPKTIRREEEPGKWSSIAGLLCTTRYGIDVQTGDRVTLKARGTTVPTRTYMVTGVRSQVSVLLEITLEAAAAPDDDLI